MEQVADVTRVMPADIKVEEHQVVRFLCFACHKSFG